MDGRRRHNRLHPHLVDDLVHRSLQRAGDHGIGKNCSPTLLARQPFDGIADRAGTARANVAAQLRLTHIPGGRAQTVTHVLGTPPNNFANDIFQGWATRHLSSAFDECEHGASVSGVIEFLHITSEANGPRLHSKRQLPDRPQSGLNLTKLPQSLNF